MEELLALCVCVCVCMCVCVCVYVCVCMCVCVHTCACVCEAASSRAVWRALCRDGLESCRQSEVVHAPAVDRDVFCEVCFRSFNRENDKARHKCLDEIRKPVSEQQDTTQCQQCLRWFRSKGGLAVHRCVPAH